MDYAGIVDEALERLKAEGRYRVFAEIERVPGTASAHLQAPDGTRLSEAFEELGFEEGVRREGDPLTVAGPAA